MNFIAAAHKTRAVAQMMATISVRPDQIPDQEVRDWLKNAALLVDEAADALLGTQHMLEARPLRMNRAA